VSNLKQIASNYLNSFPIHFSAHNRECRYCMRPSDRFLKNVISGKIIAVCDSCYNFRLCELAQNFDDSSEEEVVVTEVMSE